MLTRIHIQGFKGFKDMQIAPLRKVNLILGGQNVGKTSLLEAVYLGASPVGNVQGLPGVFRLAEGRDRQRFLEMTFKGVKGSIELGFELNGLLTNKGDGFECASLITEINLPQKKSSTRAHTDGLSFDSINFIRVIESESLDQMAGGIMAGSQALTQTPPSVLTAS